MQWRLSYLWIRTKQCLAIITIHIYANKCTNTLNCRILICILLWIYDFCINFLWFKSAESRQKWWIREWISNINIDVQWVRERNRFSIHFCIRYREVYEKTLKVRVTERQTKTGIHLSHLKMSKYDKFYYIRSHWQHFQCHTD